MGKSFRRAAPLWATYVILLGLAALGPYLSRYSGGISRGHWTFLFLMPYAFGCMPYGFVMGEIIQHRTRTSSRVAWRWGVFHAIAMYAVFLVGLFDMLLGTSEYLYYLVPLAPSVVSGGLFVLGMSVMRRQQAHSDARYGVEVSRGDPWAACFDLQWEDDMPRRVTARGDQDEEDKPKRRMRRRAKRES